MVYLALTAASDLDYSEPNSYKEMLKCKDKQHSLKAMDEEMEPLEKNGTLKLISKPKDQKVVGCKWLY